MSTGFHPISSLRTLYVTLVRPVLEFAAVVWTPHQIGHCSQLEAVQKRFLRLVGAKQGQRHWDVDLNKMAHRLNLPLLSARRMLLDLLFLFKIVNNQIDCPEILHQLDFNVPHHARG
ncbi:uncharacterized protein LOC128992811 [Macrosteles quadrilineatus]|uniref:uncharacterized protein LOC128992811 n=1 Tax=Macrosteles quadrilineatus TaxID=74068 RepID=UPI0023E0A93C|nr:uncharacterized protein LOC128992811 [Macrosteles quadrilineatus]